MIDMYNTIINYVEQTRQQWVKLTENELVLKIFHMKKIEIARLPKHFTFTE